MQVFDCVSVTQGLSAGTGKHCVFGHLGLVFIWSFVFFLFFLLFYVISAPVLPEAAVTNGFTCYVSLIFLVLQKIC